MDRSSCTWLIVIEVTDLHYLHVTGNDRDNRDDDRRDMMRCPDLADRIEECGGRNCIRRPNANETCIQCIPGCTS